MSNWFNNLGADLGAALESIKQQAEKVAEDATPAFGAAMDAVKQQAAKLKEEAAQAAQAIQQVAEQANNDILEEQERVKASADPHFGADRVIVMLPWEAEDEAKSILSQPLMEQILTLSLSEANFAPLHEEEKASFPGFKLENYVGVVMKLVALDPNLGKMHAKLGSKLPEEEFWQSYFYRCACLRAEIGIGPGEYPIVGEPSPLPSQKEAAAAASTSATASGTPTKKVAPTEASSSCKGESKGSPSRRKKGKEALEKAVGKLSKSSPAAKQESAVAPSTSAVVKKEEEEEEQGSEDDGMADDNDDDIDLDGLDLGDDDGALEGDALKELEAQIAAELDDDDI